MNEAAEKYRALVSAYKDWWKHVQKAINENRN
jgi:hypothetical protein